MIRLGPLLVGQFVENYRKIIFLAISGGGDVRAMRGEGEGLILSNGHQTVCQKSRLDVLWGGGGQLKLQNLIYCKTEQRAWRGYT